MLRLQLQLQRVSILQNMSASTEQLEPYLKMLFHELLLEGAIIISPRPGEFLRVQQSFLDGIRRVPAVIDAPPGVNPYTYAVGRPGRWLFLFLPEK